METMTFRFLDPKLNALLAERLKKSQVHHEIDGEGNFHFRSHDEYIVENSVLNPLRSSVFKNSEGFMLPLTGSSL